MNNHITLEELLAIQRELNTFCPPPETREQIAWAVLAGLGEYAQATKGDWCWWKRNGKAFENEHSLAQLSELVDVLCFLLTAMLMDGGLQPEFDHYSGSWEIGDPMLRRFHIFEWVSNWAERGSIESLTNALRCLVELVRSAGFSRDAFEAMYLAKVRINKERWTTGGDS